MGVGCANPCGPAARSGLDLERLMDALLAASATTWFKKYWPLVSLRPVFISPSFSSGKDHAVGVES